MGTEQEDLETGRNLARALVERNVVVPRALLTARQQKFFDMFVPIFQSQDERFRQLQKIRAGEIRGLRVDKFGKILIDKSTTPFGEGEITIGQRIGSEQDSGTSIRDIAGTISDIQAGRSPRGLVATQKGGTTFLKTPEESLGRIDTPTGVTLSSIIFPQFEIFKEDSLARQSARRLVSPESQRFVEDLPIGFPIGTGLFSEDTKKRQVGGLFGVGRKIIDKPVESALTFGGGFALGAGIRGLGAGTTKLGTLIGGVKGGSIASKTFSFGVAGASIGIIGSELIDLVEEVSEEEDPSKQGELVGEFFTDLALVGGGALKGEKTAGKVIGRLRTRGLTEVPIEDISDPKVLSGEKRFPEITKGETPGSLREKFFEPKLPGEEPNIARAFTATDAEIIARASEIGIGKPVKRGGITTIKSEFPGQFGSDVVSPNFLRVASESEPKLFGLDTFGGEPTLIRTAIKDIKLPKGDFFGFSKARSRELTALLGGRKGQPIEDIKLKTPKLGIGEAVAPLLKAEKEIIIRKGSPSKLIKKDFFTKIKGERIPIFEKTTGESIKFDMGFGKGKGKGKGITKLLSDSSITPKRSSLFTPSRVALGSSIFSKSSSSASKLIRGELKSSLGRSKKGKKSSPFGISRIPRRSKIGRSLSSSLGLSKSKIGKSSRSLISSELSPIRSIRKKPKRRRKIKRKLKKPRKKRKSKDDLFVQEGFVAKVTGLKGMKLTPTQARLRAKKLGGVGIRRKPLIIKKTTKKKKKKKRK